jgi:serine/threonine protein kinase
MSQPITDNVTLHQGQVVSIPFYENEKCVVGLTRSGGMGSVFQLIPLSPLKRVLALKTYQAGIDPAVFAREAKVWISLGVHRNVARALSYGRMDGVQCILAVWHDHNLLDVNPRECPIDRLLSLSSAIICGLQHSFNRSQIIHKDIKPGNILIDREGNPLVSDFGISAYAPAYILNQGLSVGPFDRATSNGRGKLAGTPRYMAPELFDGAPASIQTDIYSFGVTLFEWLMSRHPYITDDGALQFVPSRLLREEIIRSYGKEAESLASLIVSAIEVDRTKRPHSYDTLLQISGITPQRTGANEHPKVSEIVATARVLREQGNIEAARHILEMNLKTTPNDSVLLNAYGALLVTQGMHDDASAFFRKSIEADRAARALHAAEAYPDPYLNLANLYRRNSQFDAAANVIRESRTHLSGIFRLLSQERWEYAWLELLDGNPNAACDQIMTYLFRSGISEPALSIFLVSAYLSGQMAARCNKCFDLISDTVKPSLAECQHLCIVGTYLDAARRHKLINEIFASGTASLLRDVGTKVANDPKLFSIPMRREAVAAVLRGIDAEYTGGSYYDAI